MSLGAFDRVVLDTVGSRILSGRLTVELRPIGEASRWPWPQQGVFSYHLAKSRWSAGVGLANNPVLTGQDLSQAPLGTDSRNLGTDSGRFRWSYPR